MYRMITIIENTNTDCTNMCISRSIEVVLPNTNAHTHICVLIVLFTYLYIRM